MQQEPCSSAQVLCAALLSIIAAQLSPQRTNNQVCNRNPSTHRIANIQLTLLLFAFRLPARLSAFRYDDQMIAQVKNARCITVFTVPCLSPALLILMDTPFHTYFVLFYRHVRSEGCFLCALSAALSDSKSPPAERSYHFHFEDH